MAGKLTLAALQPFIISRIAIQQLGILRAAFLTLIIQEESRRKKAENFNGWFELDAVEIEKDFLIPQEEQIELLEELEELEFISRSYYANKMLISVNFAMIRHCLFGLEGAE